MAIDTTNIQAAIAAKIAAEDSAVTALELLQYGVGLSKYGATQYYTSADSLPTADSDLKGMIALVYTGDPTTGNGLYLCTGTEWFEMQDLDSAAPYSFQGSNFGYSSGGIPSPTAGTIDKFSFISDANATDVGDLTTLSSGGAGQSSSTHGYNSGGDPTFAVGDNIIEKFPFSTDANASDVGDLTVTRWVSAGQSSSENGYTSGGFAPPFSDIIDKFPFASDANASDVGDLTQQRESRSGQSSSTHGYTSGGNIPGFSDIIDKFPFASDANASDVGDLTQARHSAAGQSSTVSGYTSGGSTETNIIDKFPFASDANASDVGDLTVARYNLAGQQY